ncbi:hypothetical protein [Variovorax sp. E3]|uniref:hypothetical protein n=1 Tax=Variovorax sp. E3 TaxID=1914993 RepID=UPI0018DE94B5|nr:hypothetical protein [Variovorax sp. E3]
MTPEEINFLRSTLSGFGLGTFLAAGVAWFAIKFYATPYMGRKAQNLADKEDIAALTQQVEQVKRQHSELLEAVKFRNQLRMAAVDRRLQAHQDAFTMLRELAKDAHGPEIGKRVTACQEWWEKNCLYLEPQLVRLSATPTSPRACTRRCCSPPSSR